MILKNLKNHWLVTLVSLIVPIQLAMGAHLESPRANSHESGIGIVRGWHCNAGTIEIQFDSGPLYEAAYGTIREDTFSVCGDTNNGFSLLFNYNRLGDGQHTARAYADGVVFETSTFTVTTLGSEYLRGNAGKSSSLVVPVGKNVSLQWEESNQNFVITKAEDLPVSLSQLLSLIAGGYSGNWTTDDGSASGSLTITLAITSSGTGVELSSGALVGTACADAISAAAPIDLSTPVSEVVTSFADGSQVLWQGITNSSFTAFAGHFLYIAGPCAGLEATFEAFHL